METENNTTGLVDTLLNPTESPAQQEQQESEQQEQQTEQQSPEDARKAELDAALNELLEDGWSIDELQALVLDEKLREDIQNGKSLMRAVNAYARRQKEANPAPATNKRGTPGLRSSTAAGSGQRNTIAEMSDEEFNKYYEKTKSEALAGKKIRL